MGVATAAVVGGAIMAGGAYMASREAQAGASAQRRAAEANRAAFQGVPIPTVEEQKIILQTPELMGQYTPEQQEAMQMSVSAMEDVSADKSTVDAQKSALEGISEVAKGGFTEGDKATAREINRDVNQQAQARQKAILNSMASRGVLGSGMELAAKLQGEQQSIEQASRAGDQLTQQAQSRALQALGQQGQLAGQMRTQQFGEGADIARARDTINQFNMQNRQNVANQNVNERNRAQTLNLQQKQSLEDQRAQLANQQDMYNKQLQQQEFANRRGITQDITGANTQVGNAENAAAQGRAAMWQGIASGIGGGLMGMGGGAAKKPTS